jgi:hypothetical protein
MITGQDISFLVPDLCRAMVQTMYSIVFILQYHKVRMKVPNYLKIAETSVVFNLTSKVYRNGGVTNNLKVGQPKIISAQISEQKILMCSFYHKMPNPSMVPFQNCVQQPCPPFKMAVITENRNFFNCLLLLYYK